MTCFKIVFVPGSLLMFLLTVSCSRPESAIPGSMVRLFPTGVFLPLFEGSSDEFNQLTAKDPAELANLFYRINAQNIAHPGKIIPSGLHWTRTESISLPGRLAFSAFVISGQSGSRSVRVRIEPAEGRPVEQCFDVPVGPSGTNRWLPVTMDLPGVMKGPVTFTFALDPAGSDASGGLPVSENHVSGNEYLCIGAPVIHPTASDNQLPDVVLVVLDTLRGDFLGCYGMPEPVSPILDELSRRSDVFASAMSVSSWTKPSMNALFTGMYPNKNKILEAPFSHFRCDIALLSDELAAAGYHNLAVISNHLVTPISEYDRGFDFFDSSPIIFGTTNSTDRMQDSLRNILAIDSSGPVFLFAHCMDPHDRYVPPEPFDRMFSEPFGVRAGQIDEASFDLDSIRADLRNDIADGHSTRVINDIDEGIAEPVTATEVAYLKSQYMGEIRYVDRMIGHLIDNLFRRQSNRDIILIVLSDHGEGFMEHGSLGHGRDLYQESVHVPWLISRLKKPGHAMIINDHVSLVDFSPTLLGMLNLTSSIPNDGIDLYHPESVRPREILNFLRNQRDHLPFWRSVIQGDRKLLYVQNEPTVAFDLASDPAEMNPSALDETDSLFLSLNSLIRDDRTDRGHYEAPPKVMEQLQSLGYIR